MTGGHCVEKYRCVFEELPSAISTACMSLLFGGVFRGGEGVKCNFGEV